MIQRIIEIEIFAEILIVTVLNLYKMFIDHLKTGGMTKRRIVLYFQQMLNH